MPQPIDWPGIRAAAVALNSVRDAAMRAAAHLPQIEQTRFVERVNKRAYRERWLEKVRTVAATVQPAGKPMSKSVQTGSESLENFIQEHGNATKLALSKAARRGAEHLAESEPVEIVKSHHALRNVTAAAAQLHGWDADKAGGSVTLNVLSIGGSMSVSAS